MIKFNYDLLSEGIKEKYPDSDDIYYLMNDIISFLALHNKNYTNAQYFKIMDLQDIISSFEIF
jgi:hypothetical protein